MAKEDAEFAVRHKDKLLKLKDKKIPAGFVMI